MLERHHLRPALLLAAVLVQVGLLLLGLALRGGGWPLWARLLVLVVCLGGLVLGALALLAWRRPSDDPGEPEADPSAEP